MGVYYETIPSSLREWILEQNLLFVATAPLSGTGHVNVSPKGGKYFGIIDEKTFWYMDLTGSGNETIAHLHERGNGRITIMFNAFKGAPKIVRLWGYGRVLENGTKDFDDFIWEHNVETIPGSRSIIIVDIHQVGSSCGFSVPFYDFKEFRPTLNDHFAKMDAKHQRTGEVKDSIDHYWAYKNSWSLDGLPAMKRAQATRKKYNVATIKKFVGPLAPTHYHSGLGFPLPSVVLVAMLAFLLGLFMAIYTPTMASHFGYEIKHAPLELPTPNLTRASFDEMLGMLVGKQWAKQ